MLGMLLTIIIDKSRTHIKIREADMVVDPEEVTIIEGVATKEETITIIIITIITIIIPTITKILLDSISEKTVEAPEEEEDSSSNQEEDIRHSIKITIIVVDTNKDPIDMIIVIIIMEIIITNLIIMGVVAAAIIPAQIIRRKNWDSITPRRIDLESLNLPQEREETTEEIMNIDWCWI